MVSVKAGIPAEEYDRQWAELDDFIRFNPGARHRRRLMWRMIQDLEAKTVLDVGCGAGETLLHVAAKSTQTRQYKGVDFASATIQRNRARYPAFAFAVLDVENHALSETFDLVICSEVIEHLNNRPAAYGNLAKMVKPGGCLLVGCPSGTVYATERYFGHVSHPTREELVALGSAAGLEMVRVTEWGFPTYRLLKALVNVRPNWSLKNFASGRYSLWKRALNAGLYYAAFVNFPLPGLGCQLFAVYRRAPAKR